MFQNLTLFQTAGALAKHAAHRQSVIAQNVANADTPSYQARDVSSFKSILGSTGQPVSLKGNRAAHISSPQGPMPAVIFEQSENAKPNGNTVSIEAEILKSVEAERSHSRALAVYQSSLNILKTSIGRGR